MKLILLFFHNISLNVLLVAVFFFTSLPLAAADISELTLANGLRIIVKPEHRSASVVFQIWYKVGSSYEAEGMTGISHVLEHLMFRTDNNPRLSDYFYQLNKVGSKGGAFTTKDYTFYYHLMAKQHLALAFAMEAERMQNLSPSISGFNIEKKVVREELQTGLTKEPYLSAYNTLYEHAFKHSSYQFPVIGRPADLDALTLRQAMSWHKKYYTPDNATLVIVGDVNVSDVFNMAEKKFSAIAKGSQLRQKKSTNKHKTAPSEVRVLMPETIKLGAVLLAFKVPSIKTASPAWEAYALEVLAGWLDTGTSSRLTKALIREQQLAYNINISYSSMLREDSLFIIEAIPAQGVRLKKLEQALVDEMRVITKEAISEKTLQQIKNQMIATEIFDRDSLYTQAKIIGQAESIGMHWSDDGQYISRIKAVTVEQIKKVLSKYFISSKKILVIQNSHHK